MKLLAQNLEENIFLLVQDKENPQKFMSKLFYILSPIFNLIKNRIVTILIGFPIFFLKALIQGANQISLLFTAVLPKGGANCRIELYKKNHLLY